MKRKRYSDLTAELWFDAGVHPVERLINIEGHPQSEDLNDIGSSLSNRFMKAMDWLEGEDKKKQIIVKINSLGGMEYDMFAIYDRIKDCSCWVNIIAAGGLVLGLTRFDKDPIVRRAKLDLLFRCRCSCHF